MDNKKGGDQKEDQKVVNLEVKNLVSKNLQTRGEAQGTSQNTCLKCVTAFVLYCPLTKAHLMETVCNLLYERPKRESTAHLN